MYSFCLAFLTRHNHSEIYPYVAGVSEILFAKKCSTAWVYDSLFFDHLFDGH